MSDKPESDHTECDPLEYVTTKEDMMKTCEQIREKYRDSWSVNP